MMNAEQKARLRSLASHFRAAILQGDKCNLPVDLKDFPRGACGDASILLAKYLQQAGLGGFRYICGWRIENERPYSHAWLRQEDVIVDITADQFPEIKESVIVTDNHSWYETFLVEAEGPSDYEELDDRTQAVLAAAYQAILEHLGDAPWPLMNRRKK